MLNEIKELKEVIEDVSKWRDEHKYQMLGRFIEDCEFFINHGNRYEKRLWAGNIKDHINYMKEVYRYCKRSSIQEAFVFQIFTGINSYKAAFELRCIVCDNKIVAISTKPSAFTTAIVPASTDTPAANAQERSKPSL